MRSSATSCAAPKHGRLQLNSCSLRNLVDAKPAGSPSRRLFCLARHEVNKITMIDESRFPEDILAEAEEEASTSEEPINEFDGLDLRGAQCFGYGCPKASSWTNLAEIALDKGWGTIDVQQLESGLLHNVEACYYKIA